MYMRFIELYRSFLHSPDEQKLKTFETVIRHSYRLRSTHMVHSLAQYRTEFRSKAINISKKEVYYWQVPEEPSKNQPTGNPWKSSEPFTTKEAETVIARGVAANRLVEFEPRDFGTDLVPATMLNLEPVKRETFEMTRGAGNFYVYAPVAGAPLKFTMSAGHVYQDRGDAKLMLFEAVDNLADEGEENEDNDENPVDAEPIAQAIVKPAAEPKEVEFRAPRAGLYRVKLGNSGQGVKLDWPETQPLMLPANIENAANIARRGGGYFYVPKGTVSVGGFADGEGDIRNATGEKVYELQKKGEYFNIAVGPGQDGKLWHFSHAAGQLSLMTVPPYLAQSEKELLLPREVVEVDRAK